MRNLKLQIEYDGSNYYGWQVQNSSKTIQQFTPQIIRSNFIDPENLQIVREGMRLGVTDGISVVLNVPYVDVASKTGTAELGVSKALVNSWSTGFFPYENPRYAFAVIMEKGSRDNLTGSIFVMRGLLDWMSQNATQYLK